MLRCLLLFISILIISTELQAQQYGNALGIRVDRNTVGINFKQRVFKFSTVDAIMAFNLEEGYLKGLYSIHKPILYKGLNYYYGGGAHAGIYRGVGPYIGLDLTVGLELKVPVLPLLVSADFTPSVHLNHPRNIQLQTGIAVLFVMRSERDIKRNKRKRGKSKKKKGALGDKLDGFLNR